MLRKFCFLLLALFVIPCISHAEIKTYTYTVKQSFGGSQSPDDARVSAIHKAKREVLEKAGTYLESLTIVKNSMVEKDEILALAAGVLKAEVVSEKKFLEGNEFGIYVSAKVDVDTSILKERVKELLGDRVLFKKYQDSQKREKELLAKIARLEEENRKISSSPASADSQKKEELKKQFREATQGLTASELFEKTLDFWENRKYTDPDKALEYLNKAIILDSKYATAYNHRGIAWGNKGDYDRAISDYNKAIELDPGNAKAYNNRGVAWDNKGDYDRAISDYNKTIVLNPGTAEVYYNRGLAWGNKGDYDREIADYNKAIELNSGIAKAYNNRAIAYYRKGEHDKARDDVYKAQSLGYQVYPGFLKILREASGRQR